MKPCCCFAIFTFSQPEVGYNAERHSLTGLSIKVDTPFEAKPFHITTGNLENTMFLLASSLNKIYKLLSVLRRASTATLAEKNKQGK